MKHRNLSPVLCLSALAVALGGLCGSGSRAEATDLPYVPGEVLVRFKPQTASSTSTAQAAGLRVNNALLAAGAQVREVLATQTDRDSGRTVVRAATRLSVLDAVAQLRKDPTVEFAEPNWRLHRASVSNDTEYSLGNMWGSYSNDQPVVGPPSTSNGWGSGAEQAWAQGATGSSTVYVGVLDEGVDFNHPDLADNVWTNPFDPADGVDNDGNGYVDDIHGWDFVNGDSSVADAGEDQHGTHVAGTIGAKGGNGIGVAGVNWDVTLIPAKFLSPYGGTSSDAIRALNYLRDLKSRHGLNIVATCNSWTGMFYSRSLHEAILGAAKQDILFVAAAGNDSSDNDATPSYPGNFSTLQGTASVTAASYEAVISVAALDAWGNLASFSNYGASSVDLAAPGDWIESTLPGGGYGYKSGTSMAAPHVAGAAALYAAANPGATAAQIRSALVGNTVPTASLVGRCATGGRLSLAGNFLTPPAITRDVAVSSVSAPTSVNQGSVATVTVPVSNPGQAPESFTVALSAASGTPSAAQNVSLPAGGSTTLTFSWNTSGVAAGSYPLTATATPVPGETNTANNTAQRSVSVSTVVRDGAVRSLSVPATLQRGTNATASVQVANEGSQTETFSVSLSASSGSTSGTQTVTLAAGAVQTLSFSWNTTGASTGTNTVTASVAALSGETDTADNSRSSAVNITAPTVRDVAVTAVSLPTTVYAGKAVTVTVTYLNQGTVTETFTASITATVGTISAAQSVTLAPGASVTKSFTWTTKASNKGTHTVTGRASTVSGEVDTSDNTLSVSRQVK